MRLIAKLAWIGERPDAQYGFDHRSDRRTPLRDHKNPGAVLTLGKVSPKMADHGAAVVSYQNAAFGCGPVEDFRITQAVQFGLKGRREIYRGFGAPHGPDDSESEIVVRLKPNAQERGSVCAASALKRWILAHSSGLCCSSGIARPSNS